MAGVVTGPMPTVGRVSGFSIAVLMAIMSVASLPAADVQGPPVPSVPGVADGGGAGLAPPTLTMYLQPSSMGVSVSITQRSAVVFDGRVEVQEPLYRLGTISLSAACTWSALLNYQSISLLGSSAGTFNVTVLVPAGTLPNKVGALTVTATLTTAQGLVASTEATSTMTILPYNFVSVRQLDALGTVGPGQHVTIRAHLDNFATEPVTFALRLGTPPRGFDVEVPVDRSSVGADGSWEFTLEVDVPRDADGGQYGLSGIVNMVEPDGALGEVAGPFYLVLNVETVPLERTLLKTGLMVLAIVVPVVVTVLVWRRRRRSRKDREALASLEPIEVEAMSG